MAVFRQQTSSPFFLIHFIVFLLCVLVNPAIGILLFTLYIAIEKKGKECILPFAILIILFLACLNAVRVPESDTVWYYEYYYQVPKFSFIKYIYLRGKEPVFGIFNWVTYQFIGHHASIYGAFITVICYSLLLRSVYRFGKANHYSNANIIFGIIAMAFIPYIFTQSNHAIRQFLANSILSYVMVERIFYKKKMYVLIICMFFIHSSSGLFIPFLFLPFLRHPIAKSNIHYYACVIIGILTYRIAGEALLPIMSNNESLGYVASRMSQNISGGMVMKSYMIVLNIVTLIGLIFFSYRNRKTTIENLKVIPFMHILCALVVYVLANYNQDVISTRFNFYIWVFFPFILMFGFHVLKLKTYLYYGLSIGIYIYSFYYLEELGTWTYNTLMPIYKTPLLYY